MKRPARSGGGKTAKPKADLTQPIEEIQTGSPESIEKLRRYHAELGEILAQYDTGRSPFDRLSRHVRRHLPLYALAAVFALVVVLVPTTNNNGSVSSIAAGAPADAGSFDAQTAQTEVGASVASRAGRLAGRNAAGAVESLTGGPVGKVEVGTGITRGGIECKPGVRQLLGSAYAFPCIAKFAGNNGGNTYRGVTKDKIRFVIRKTADSGGPSAATVDQANKAAGRAARTEYLEFVKKYWLPYFNKNMELFGRTVEFVEYGSTQSNGVDEAQSKGKDGACADATAIANNVKAFGDLLFATGFGESQPFAQCATEKGGIFVPIGAAYFPEGVVKDPKGINLTGVSYQSWQPYVWHIAMQCEQIGVDVAEYMGKRLNGRPAKWARDAAYRDPKYIDPNTKTAHGRVFGTYVPDNDGYQHCVNISEKQFEDKYGGKIASRHNYPLDVSRFPDQAAQAAVKFQSAGVTTLINACDTISTQLLTEAADKNQWGPEWYIIGVATQDTNGSARSFNDNAINGHLFGMSQLGPDALTLGKDSEPYRAFKAANPGVTPPQGSLQAYWPMLHIFNLLQAAGPILTPQNIQLAVQKMPPGGGAKGALGTWSLRDHTEIDDSREIYWNPTFKAVDGTGSYIETYGGERFGSGEWPAEEPKVYPK